MSAENTAMLQRVDASVAIAGELKADVTLDFDFVEEKGADDAAAAAGSGGDSTTQPSAAEPVADAVPVPDSPFSSLPERAPPSDPYSAAFRAGFIPSHPPPTLVQQ